MGAAAINSSKAAFIVRILVESLQHRQDPRVLQIRRLLEAGFTGMRTDKRGVKRYYRDGRQIANPTAVEKKAVTNRGQRAVAKHLRISHDEAKSRISAIGPNTPPEHIKALANDLMNLSYKDLIRIKQDLGARGGWGSKAKMTDRLQQGVTRNELPTATRAGLQAVRVQRSADGKGLEIDPTGQSNRIAWQTPDGKLHSTAIGAYGHLKQNKHLVEPAKAAEKAQQATEKGNQSGIGDAGDLVSLDTSKIHVDPSRFQYKQKLDSTTGAGDNLKNVNKFNSLFAGVIHAWKDPADGKIYVVNGHHRMELAKRAGHKKMNVQMIEAPDAATARSTGALINMAEGRGTALDAAKFLRDSGQSIEDLRGHGISLKEKVVDNAVQLKGLSQRIFNDLASGILDEDKAVAIGRHLKDHQEQEQLYNHYLEQKEKHNKEFSAATLEQAAQDVAKAPKQQGGGQMDLFGNTDEGKSLFLEKAELKNRIRALLSQEVNDYSVAGNARRAKNIAGAGNVLQVDKNKELSKEADRIKQAYEQFQHLSGPVSDAINAHVEEYANAKGSKRAIVEKSLAAVRAALQTVIDSGSQGDVRPSGQDSQDNQGTGSQEPANLSGDVRPGNAANVSAAKPPEPGFTGIDAEGREWRNGELVHKQDEPSSRQPGAPTDLFGKPLPSNKPAEPATMKGLFGEPVPINPDQPSRQAEPIPGTDNPLDRQDAAKKDDTQDMFGLFGPGGRPQEEPKNPTRGGEKYFGTGGDHVTVTLPNGKKGIIPPPMENVPGWQDYEPIAPKSFYGLNEEEAVEHREAQELVRREWPKFRQEYLSKMGTFDPETGELISITCNCDDWRDLFPTYRGTNSGTIHDAASYANMRMLNEAMALMKGKGNNQFLVLGGGGGSGKGTATKGIIKASEYPVVLDSVSDDSQWTKELMDMAAKHGFGGQFVFIDRAPADAWKDGVVKRAMEARAKFDAGDKTSMARTVPLSVAVPANLKARRAAYELLEDGSVPTIIINNNLGFGNAEKIELKDSASYLQSGINQYNKDELLKEMEDDTYRLYESGKIPHDIAQGLLSSRAINARRLQSRSTGGSDSAGASDGRKASQDPGGATGQAPLDGGTIPADNSPGKGGQAGSSDEESLTKPKYFENSSEIPQFVKDAGWDSVAKLKKRGITVNTIKKVENHADAIVRSVATYVDNPKGQIEELKKKLIYQVAVEGNMDSALGSLEWQYQKESQRDHWAPSTGPGLAKISQAIADFRAQLKNPGAKEEPTEQPTVPTTAPQAQPTPAPDDAVARHMQRQAFTGIDSLGREWRNGELVAKQEEPAGANAEELQEPEEPKQKRAAAGGEIGPNGEFYKGGAFIATTDMPKRLKDKIKKEAGDGTEKVIDPATGNISREKPPSPSLMSISAAMVGTWMGPDGEVNQQYLDYRGAGAGAGAGANLRSQIEDLAQKYRRGEKWAAINEFPEVAKGDHIYRLAAEGLPIAGVLLQRMKPEFQRYFKHLKFDATATAAQPEPEKSNKAPGVSLNDVPFDMAYNAHRGTSFVPDTRARQRQQDYVSQMQADWEHLSKFAKTPEQQDILRNEFARYKLGYLEKYKASLQAHARTMSAMIAGPARFPTSRNSKAMDSADKRSQEVADFRERALGAAAKAINPELSGSPVLSRDANAVQTLQAQLDKLTQSQELMKKMNAAYAKFLKNPDSLAASGLSEKLQQSIRDFHNAPNKDQRWSWHNTPFPAYALKNNGANIRRIQQRIDSLQKMKEQPAQEIPYSNGVTVSHDPEGARIRIKFPGKPSSEVIQKIKSRGFVWSPSHGTWQRQLNSNGLNATDSLMKELGHEKLSQTTTEAVMPTDHAAKIKLIQSIIAQTGATPPKPKQAQEAEQDPRVQRIRELLGQRC